VAAAQPKQAPKDKAECYLLAAKRLLRAADEIAEAGKLVAEHDSVLASQVMDVASAFASVTVKILKKEPPK